MHSATLPEDLERIAAQLATRRKVLGWMVSAGVAPLVGCDGLAPSRAPLDASTGNVRPDAGGSASARDAGLSTTSHDAAAGSASDAADVDGAVSTCTATPAETGGPFPADSTIGPNVLVRSGIVRRDIRNSFALGSATAEGVELTVTLTVLEPLSCRPRPGAVVYLWHCDREGRYSLYSQGATDQDYLRGAQICDAQGRVTFTTIFPGCYPGRWPHMHFEVFADLETATTAGSPPVLTSQLAFTRADCETAYGVAGYEASTQNLQQLSLQTDGVFRDGVAQQLATITGTPTDSLLATLTVTT